MSDTTEDMECAAATMFDESDIWTTVKGDHIPIKELTDNHLNNIVKMLEKNGDLWRFPNIQYEKERRSRTKKYVNNS